MGMPMDDYCGVATHSESGNSYPSLVCSESNIVFGAAEYLLHYATVISLP